MFKSGSLRGRLLRRLAFLLAIILLISSFTAYWSARRAADTAYDRTLLASARAVVAGLYSEDGHLSANIPYIALDSFAYDSEGRIYYQVLDPKGALVSGYEGLPGPPASVELTRDYPALARFYDAEYLGQGVRVVSLMKPVSEPDLTGMAEIRVAETLGARERLARDLLMGTLWRMLFLSLTALLLVWLAVSVALRPLNILRRRLDMRSSDELRPLPVESMPRELQPLILALNQFNERLRNLFERQSQFIADASHELRTPLATMKARVELGLRSSEPEVWLGTLQATAQSTDKLTHLANQLLSLARIESGARAILEGGAQPLDLTELARELGLAMAPLAHGKGIALALEAEEPVWVRGEPTLLNELLSNLLDNALAHTRPGGNVILRVLPAGTLEVEDDGPGIPEAEYERVFARFYRTTNRSTGAGLGLAIVGEICRAHQANISLHQAASGGLLVRVTFTSVG
ncbi:sensor histidine kinase [Ectopseudomonas mendocina]|uniref:histidine kinase n=1 Tax=Ectopseudomonas mendocina TaxID=300 RepID=A0ABZ2RBY8_ECTME